MRRLVVMLVASVALGWLVTRALGFPLGPMLVLGVAALVAAAYVEV